MDMANNPDNQDSDQAAEIDSSTIMRQNRLMLHAIECLDPKCLSSCQKMKRVTLHAMICKRKVEGGCTDCKEHFTLYAYHTHRCQNTNCPLPFCSDIKHKLNAIKSAEVARKLSLQQDIESLMHACQFRKCLNMKRIMHHNLMCQRQTKNKFDTCRKLNMLVNYHVQDCQGPNCCLSLCVKVKLSSKKVLQRNRQHQLPTKVFQLIEQILQSKPELIEEFAKKYQMPLPDGAMRNQQRQQQVVGATQGGSGIIISAGSALAPRLLSVVTNNISQMLNIFRNSPNSPHWLQNILQRMQNNQPCIVWLPSRPQNGSGSD